EPHGRPGPGPTDRGGGAVDISHGASGSPGKAGRPSADGHADQPDRGAVTGPPRPTTPAPMSPSPMSLAEVSRACERVLDEVCRAVVGKRYELSLVLAGILAGGHVLLEDYPGLGKTLAARSFAQTLGLDFRRLQFTPDMLPADVTGSFVYDQARGDFAFRPGP